MSELWALGSQTLEVDALAPAHAEQPTLLLAHPHPSHGGSMNNKIILQLFRRARDLGLGACRFNFRGVGRSTGMYGHGLGEREDLWGMFEACQQRLGVTAASIVAVGYSFGAAVLSYSLERPEMHPAQVALIAPPVGFMKVSSPANYTGPLDVFLAENDELISYENSVSWAKDLREPKRIHVISGADHYFIGKTTQLLTEVMACIPVLKSS